MALQKERVWKRTRSLRGGNSRGHCRGQDRRHPALQHIMSWWSQAKEGSLSGPPSRHERIGSSSDIPPMCRGGLKAHVSQPACALSLDLPRTSLLLRHTGAGIETRKNVACLAKCCDDASVWGADYHDAQ